MGRIHIFKGASLLLFIGMMTACTYYRHISIEVLRPAQFNTGNEKKLGIIDRNILCTNAQAVRMEQFDESNRENLYDEFVKGIKQVLAETQRYEKIVTLKEEDRTLLKEGVYPVPYTKEEIDTMCLNFGVREFVSLEYQFYEEDIKAGTFYNKWLMRYYSVEKGMPIDSVVLTDTLSKFMKSYDLPMYIPGGAHYIGYQYGRRIAPYWDQETRRIYTKGKILRLGDACFKANDMDRAVEMWKAALDLSPAIAVQACCNLAWLYENAGDFGQAETILSQGIEIAGKKGYVSEDVDYMNKYLTIIRRRIKDNKLLDIQTGGE